MVRNLIVGCIAAVCCLQISFQLYMAVDADYLAMSESDAVGQISVNGVPVAELPETSVDGPTPQQVSKRSRGLEDVYRAPEMSTAVAQRKASDRVPQLAMVAFKRKTPAPVPTSTLTRVPVTTFTQREEPAKDRKPFIAKALPMIKKPYDWIKALAIRLR